MRQYLFLVFLLFTCSLFSQSFNYQTVVRDSDGQVLKNQQANFDIQILLVDSLVYAEEHTVNTGDLGIVNFQIGQGANQSNNFSEIDWSSGQYKLRLKINGEEIGVSDIVAVPIAIYSESSKSSSDWLRLGDSSLTTQNKNVEIQGNLDVQGDYLWESTKDFKMLGDSSSIGEYSFDFPNADGEKRWHVWDPIHGSILSVKNDDRVGIGVANPKDPLHVLGLIRVSGGTSNQKLRFYSGAPDQDNQIYSYSESSDFMWGITMGDRSHSDMFRIEAPNGITDFGITQDGNVGIGTSIPDEKLVVNGRTKTKTLEITGGGDGAEYFQAEDLIEPGTLVSVDVEKEESIKVCDHPYSKKVIGVISRAGGINPGITLQQNEVLEGNNLVSLWGRVYVKATSENGKIKPGDLLTSSSVSGHVMKATSKRKRKEAVVGMALTSLDKGEGLVKILIHRQ